jgi:hypothetical protein
VSVPLALSVVKAPVLAEVAPIDVLLIVPPPMVADGVLSDENAPLLVETEPIGPGAENVAPPSVTALMVALHPKPEPAVYTSADEEPTQFETETAVGVAVDPVLLPRTVFAPIGAKLDDPHAGALDGPVETIDCPAADPAGLSNWIGVSVAPNAIDVSARSAAAKSRIRFIVNP